MPNEPKFRVEYLVPTYVDNAIEWDLYYTAFFTTRESLNTYLMSLQFVYYARLSETLIEYIRYAITGALLAKVVVKEFKDEV